MGESFGAQLFWMTGIGLMMGFAGYYLFGRRGMTLKTSLLMATAGFILMGIIAYIFQFAVTLTYSVIGAAAFLFIPNAFQQKDKSPSIEKEDSDPATPK